MAELCSSGLSRATIKNELRDAKFQNIITIAKDDAKANFKTADYNGSDTACIQAALDSVSSSGGGEIWIMEGQYSISSQLAYTGSNLHIRGQGDLTVLDFSGISSEITNFINIHGAITGTNSLLTANAAAGAITITVANASLFAAGDWIRIRTNAIYWTYEGNNVHPGEIRRIKSIDAATNVITLMEAIGYNYYTADTATIDKVTMITDISIKNLKIVGPPGVYHRGITVYQAHKLTIEGVSTEDVNTAAIAIYDVVGANIDKNVIKRSTNEGNGYGLMVVNCSRDISAMFNNFSDCRHGIACGSDYTYGIQYNLNFSLNKMEYDWHVVGLFGPHPTYIGLVMIGNTCTNCSLGFINGKNNVVIGNTVLNGNCSALEVWDEVDGAIITGNTFETSVDHCVLIQSAKRVKLADNHIVSTGATYDGILVRHDIEELDVHHNEIHSAGAGITVTTSSGTIDTSKVSLKDNEIYTTGTEAAISIVSTSLLISDIDVVRNTIHAAANGIVLSLADKNITDAVIEDNKIWAVGDSILSNPTGSGVLSRVSVSNNKCHVGTISIYAADALDVINNHMFDVPSGNAISLHANITNLKATGNGFTNCSGTMGITAGTTGKYVTGNPGYLVGTLTPPAENPVSETTYTNNYGCICRVTIYSGTVSNIVINGVYIGLISGSFILYPSETISVVHTGNPTWKWEGL